MLTLVWIGYKLLKQEDCIMKKEIKDYIVECDNMARLLKAQELFNKFSEQAFAKDSSLAEVICRKIQVDLSMQVEMLFRKSMSSVCSGGDLDIDCSMDPDGVIEDEYHYRRTQKGGA